MTRQNLDATCSDSGRVTYRFWTRYLFPRSDSGREKTLQSLSGLGLSGILTAVALAFRFWTPKYYQPIWQFQRSRNGDMHEQIPHESFRPSIRTDHV